MAWLWERPAPTLVNVYARGMRPGQQHYRGTRPLAGDWEALRFGFTVGPVVWTGVYNFGIRLATEIPATFSEWEEGERLFYGDGEEEYLGDGVALPHGASMVVEGPFRLRARGRRLVFQLGMEPFGIGPSSVTVSLTAVLQQVR